MPCDPIFAGLTALIAHALGGATPVVYWPVLSPGVSFAVEAILDTPREMDEKVDASYLEVFIDGGNPLFLVARPHPGDQLVTNDGLTYIVSRVNMDGENGVELLCRIKGRPPGY